jgi:hypothetical protein
MTMSNLFNNRPYHHKDTTLLDRVVKQIHIDLDDGDFDPIYVLLDYLSEDVLKAYLPEETADD